MDKMVAYTKQSGVSAVPVTVRIDWLPDGTIKPLLYWTPDGTCYEIAPNCKSTPLAFLRERGDGLRFEVTAKIIETLEPDDNLMGSHYRTYLYLADKRFYQKNIIDARYGHAGKEFIPVTLDVFPNGDYELLSFKVQGEQWQVDKTIEVKPRGSFNAGGIGIWHKVDASNNSVRRIAALYLELNKWFVAVSTKTA